AAGNGWNDNFELVITASMMILNFITEFLWDKFVVFNDRVTDKLLRLFKKKSAPESANGTQEEIAATNDAPADGGNDTPAEENSNLPVNGAPPADGKTDSPNDGAKKN
ncbi:MAG: hypothetical protein NC548_43475, partial [Lachnospiraceae bacterium]|nr:hypothetical protein [Lachnospiraceae bacterium]